MLANFLLEDCDSSMEEASKMAQEPLVFNQILYLHYVRSFKQKRDEPTFHIRIHQRIQVLLWFALVILDKCNQCNTFVHEEQLLLKVCLDVLPKDILPELPQIRYLQHFFDLFLIHPFLTK